MFGSQFAAVFQSPLVGFVAQVALPASKGWCAAKTSSATAITSLGILNDVLIGC
jgi:hypothetical protein